MPKLISFHLLGVWLLLSQLPRESQGQNWNTVIKACGRELVRLQIRICGNSLSSWRDMNYRRVGRESGSPTETEPTSMKRDEEDVERIVESFTKAQQPELKHAHIEFKEYEKTISRETEDNILSNLISKGSNKQLRRKRQVVGSLSSKCCHSGCTLREVARFC